MMTRKEWLKNKRSIELPPELEKPKGIRLLSWIKELKKKGVPFEQTSRVFSKYDHRGPVDGKLEIIERPIANRLIYPARGEVR